MSKKELENYKETDPIEIVKSEILNKKIANEEEVEKINKNIINEIKNAAEFALSSDYPNDSELYTDVYV